MKKICVVTGSRAEFGLLYGLIQAIQQIPEFKLQLVVTGSHLSPEFGMTVEEIQIEFQVDKKIEIVLSADTPTAISKSIGLGMISMSDAFEGLKPELVVLLGDRYEMLAAAICAHVAKIPIAHLHGGELSQGAIDDGFRHAITKLSHLHFTSTQAYRDRVIQLGENPKNVFCVGALGVENIKKMSLLSRKELELRLKFQFLEQNAIITYHPTTLDDQPSEAQFKALLKSLECFPGMGLIFTKTNQDTDGRIINHLIDEFVSQNPGRTISFHSMGQLNYFSALQYVDVAIGNSSSALIEVPAFDKPSVNIGSRQSGRIRAASVIDCLNDTASITDAIHLALSPDFLTKIKPVKNPYDSGMSSELICNTLRKIEFNSLIIKRFYDLNG